METLETRIHELHKMAETRHQAAWKQMVTVLEKLDGVAPQLSALERNQDIAGCVRLGWDLDSVTCFPSPVTLHVACEGALFVAGLPVDLEEVNSTYGGRRSQNIVRKPKIRHLLVDLPPYQWNYEKRYWV